MNLQELRIQQRRIKIENTNEPKKHVFVVLPIHADELDDIIQSISGYNEYGPNEENIQSHYTLGNIPVDIRKENKATLNLFLKKPEYSFGKNPSVLRDNGEFYTGRARKKGSASKPLPISRIRNALLSFFSTNQELADYYSFLVHETWEYCYENKIAFKFGYGHARELFFLPTLTGVESSGILIRADDEDFYEDKKEGCSNYEPTVEVLYGNQNDGYDANLDGEMPNKSEWMTMLKNEAFSVPLSKGKS